MSLAERFQQDRQGRRFADVLNDPRISFRAILAFFDDPDRQRRMVESELHHDRPALAGVVRELEALPEVHEFFRAHESHTTTRFRQAIGVVVRIVMEGQGYRRTGRKGSLGVRAKVPSRQKAAGPHYNTGGLALWFTRAERYEPPFGTVYRSVAQRAEDVRSGKQIDF